MQTLEAHIKALQDIVKQYPHLADKPIIYAVDDEGNAYHPIHNEPSLTQVEDIDQHYLEVIGHYDDESDEIAIEDCNCITIN